MTNTEPLTQLPADIAADWLAELHPATPTAQGVFRLVNIRRTDGASFEGQRITVLVLDENGIAIPSATVAFSYSTAAAYVLTPAFLWSPPMPRRAFIVPTGGGGQIDMVLGAEGVVKQGQAGGVTAYILEPEYSSDVVSGLGMMADHTGLHLTFALQRAGVKSTAQRLSALEEWVTNFDERLKAVE